MADYSTYDKSELLKVISRLEKELKTKKYGLVWDSEKEPEQIVLDCENNLPILKRIKSKEIKTNDNEDNILIEGDNYHALTVLNYTHKEKIDVIYIDPPYNTGKKDFIYNDRYIDSEHSYKHSTWLTFMEKRLNLAKNLLTKNGVIFISIDDNEFAQLKLLCDRIFGQDNLITNFIWNKKNVVQNDAKFASINHEYLLSYRVNKVKDRFELLPRTDEMNARYSNPDNDPRGNWTSVALQAKSGSQSTIYEVEFSNGVKWKPVDGTFARLSKQSLLKAYNEDRLWFGKTGKNIPRLKKYLLEVKQGVVTNSIWLNHEVGSTQIGKEDLKNIIGKNIFDTPKPKNLIIKCINLVSKSKKLIVLDFFAGSGTTGHAVLELNKQDNGNRQFILCTNNENDICKSVTYPRISKVINGYKTIKGKDVNGLGGNLQYFKTDFVKKTNSRDQVKINLTKKCTEMLCVKENIFNITKKEKDYKIFISNKSDKFLCIYYNFIEDSIYNFIEDVRALDGNKIVYIFSINNEANKTLFSGIDDLKVEAIPQNILDIYKQLVKMNIPLKTNVIFTDYNKAKTKIFIDKDKDDGARVLRVVLEKLIQKISQDNSINILNAKAKEVKATVLNDNLYNQKIITQIDWEENKTFLTIGNNASHGDYDDYELSQVEKFYRHIQTLMNNYNV